MKPGVKIWFCGRLCEVKATWQSAEFVDGHLCSPGYWEITDLIEIETGMDVWLNIQRSAELTPDEAEELPDEVYNWLLNPPAYWSEDPLLYLAVEDAITQTTSLIERSNLTTYLYKRKHTTLGDLL